MNYYISDLHLGHKNVLSFDNRPFGTIEENDKIIINNWNETIGMYDDVYILGDISWHNSTKTIEIFKQLNGIKHLIVGNHDTKLLKNKDMQKLFIEICQYKEIIDEIDGKSYNLVLCHYPIYDWKNMARGWVHLYGHVHSNKNNEFYQEAINKTNEHYNSRGSKNYNKFRCYNVGCMLPYMNYTPRTFKEIAYE